MGQGPQVESVDGGVPAPGTARSGGILGLHDEVIFRVNGRSVIDLRVSLERLDDEPGPNAQDPRTSAMYRPADRRFNLVDGIILIAALAIMLAGLKSKYEADLQYAQSARSAGPAQVPPSQPRLRFLLEGYMPHMLVPLTVAAWPRCGSGVPVPSAAWMANQPGSRSSRHRSSSLPSPSGRVLVRMAGRRWLPHLGWPWRRPTDSAIGRQARSRWEDGWSCSWEGAGIRRKAGSIERVGSWAISG